jgi:GT2 family glycosyltransferase
LFPKALWEELGGFDARFESFGEDVDLSLRLMRKGVRVQVAGRAIHLLGASYGRGGVEKVRRIERNRVRAAIRSLPVSALMLMPLVTAGRYGLAAGLKAVGKGPGAHVEKGAGKAALTGLMEGILDIPEWWEARKSDSVGWTRAEWAMWQALMEGRVRLQDLLR